MSEPKVTREKMLEWTCKAHEAFPDDINIIYAIRALIEKVGKWQDWARR